MPYQDTQPAREVALTKAANRAVDDPAKLAKAARIVRAALARRALTPRDLEGAVVKPSDLTHRNTADSAA